MQSDHIWFSTSKMGKIPQIEHWVTLGFVSGIEPYRALKMEITKEKFIKNFTKFIKRDF